MVKLVKYFLLINVINLKEKKNLEDLELKEVIQEQIIDYELKSDKNISRKAKKFVKNFENMEPSDVHKFFYDEKNEEFIKGIMLKDSTIAVLWEAFLEHKIHKSIQNFFSNANSILYKITSIQHF